MTPYIVFALMIVALYAMLHAWVKKNDHRRLRKTDSAAYFRSLQTIVSLKGIPEKNTCDAIVRLGRCYELGEGTPKDAEKAKETFWLGYERGDPVSILHYSRMLAQKAKTPDDYRNVAKMLRPAAEKKLLPAECLMGSLCCFMPSMRASDPQAEEFVAKYHKHRVELGMPLVESGEATPPSSPASASERETTARPRD